MNAFNLLKYDILMRIKLLCLSLTEFKEVAANHWSFSECIMLFFLRASSHLTYWKVTYASLTSTLTIFLEWSFPVPQVNNEKGCVFTSNIKTLYPNKWTLLLSVSTLVNVFFSPWLEWQLYDSVFPYLWMGRLRLETLNFQIRNSTIISFYSTFYLEIK